MEKDDDEVVRQEGRGEEAEGAGRGRTGRRKGAVGDEGESEHATTSRGRA